MGNRFIKNILLIEKYISNLKIHKHGERPEKMSVSLNFTLNDNDALSQYKKGERHKFNIAIELKISEFQDDIQNLKEAEILLEAKVEIELVIEFIKNFKSEDKIAETFFNELLSLSYDDLKLVLESNIGRTAFRGFYMPVDFREILNYS